MMDQNIDISNMQAAEKDRLQFHRLAGGDIVGQPPLFSPDGDLLFVLCGEIIKVFSSMTGQLVRELRGSKDRLISMALELKDHDIMVGCTCTGKVLRWTWATGNLKTTHQLKIPQEMEFLTFNLLNMYEQSQIPCAFVTFKNPKKTVQWRVVDIDTGEALRVPCTLSLSEDHVMVDAQTNRFKNLVVVQGWHVYFINYKTWQWKGLYNAHKVPVTVVRVHPCEELVATGDEVGKIFLWRQFMDHRTVTTSLYHWHHTYVTSIAFSATGTTFYSSGLEAVLVKWNVERREQREFLPRVASVICHIAVSQTNSKVAISTADNGVQFIGNDFQLKNTLQEFTYVYDYKTEQPKFPAGLRFNPRTNTLALNGRTGHLQFYSTHTRSFLYNMDIVQQNKLSVETGKILYDIQVSKVAFNIDWMATGEVYNDQQHLPELRLKFWSYDETKQCYCLNTNIETPHEFGFIALEFSNASQIDNLLCASVGQDNIIRIWALSDSENICQTAKVWICITRTQFKTMSIESISFSQDGSLLAAGYGNSLSIYTSETMKLKTVLTTTPATDGVEVRQARIKVPKLSNHSSHNKKQQLAEPGKVLSMFFKWLESNEKALPDAIRQYLNDNARKMNSTQNVNSILSSDLIDETTTELLYQKIMATSELSYWQKVILIEQLGIRVKVLPKSHSRLMAYLAEAGYSNFEEKEALLDNELSRLCSRERFKARYRLYRYKTNRRKYDTDKLTDILTTLSLNNTTDQSQSGKSTILMETDTTQEKKLVNNEQQGFYPLLLSQFKHVQFAAGEHAHLIIGCTESRVFIWNLLTLRLQSVLKLSTQHFAFDSVNNLVAIVTRTNELYIFQPNVPMPIYHRSNVPKLYGIIWMPRRHFKQRSINIDWQAQSTLYFFTYSQEIMFLGSTMMAEADEPPFIVLPEKEMPMNWQYTTFGTYASKQNSEKITTNGLHPSNGPLIIGTERREVIEAFVNMTSYTMPPLRRMCLDVMKPFLNPANESAPSSEEVAQSTKMTNGISKTNGYSHSDSENEEADSAITWKALIAKRRAIRECKENSASSKLANQSTEHDDVELKAQRLADFEFNIDF